jgi:hypothetical protein
VGYKVVDSLFEPAVFSNVGVNDGLNVGNSVPLDLEPLPFLALELLALELLDLELQENAAVLVRAIVCVVPTFDERSDTLGAGQDCRGYDDGYGGGRGGEAEHDIGSAFSIGSFDCFSSDGPYLV